MDLLPTQPLVKRVIYQLCKMQYSKQQLHSSRLIMCITDVLKTEDDRCKYSILIKTIKL